MTEPQGNDLGATAPQSLSVRRFRKRPVEIEAFQWDGDYETLSAVLGQNWNRADARDIPWEHEDGEEVIIWNSLEKVWLPVPLDHWIVRGVRGEFYPVAPDVFAQTYDDCEAVVSEIESPA